MEAALASVEHVLTAQRALVTWKQLTSAGITEQSVRRLVDRRVLSRVRTGVYALVGAPDSWERGLHGAVLAAEAGAVASHSSAARLWVYAILPEDRYEVTVPDMRRPRIVGVRVHRTTILDDDDVTIIAGIPCTTFERTLSDCTTLLSLAQLGRVLDDGLRRKVASLTRLRDCAERIDSGPGRRMSLIRTLLAERGAGYDPGGSRSELNVLDVIRRAGLPEPVQQHVVRTKGATYRLDFAWPDYKVYAEWYGLPFHVGASAVTHDSRRVTALSALGWLPAIFTNGATEVEIVEGVRELLNRRGFGWVETAGGGERG
jgi:hypothetical protein